MSESIRYDEEGRPTHKANGQLAPGNRWMMPRWQPGQSGRPAKYSPTKLWYAVKDYVEGHQATQLELMREIQGYEPRRLTWTGLANALGMTRQSLDAYAKGEIGKTDDDKAGVSAVLAQYHTLMEQDLEEMLTSKAFATNGVIFALKNQAGWRDEKHLSVESQQEQRLIVQLPPELATRLQSSGAQIEHEVIEGEYSKG